MKYEVIVKLKDCIVVDWRFKSITQVCKFIDSCDSSFVDFAVYRIGSYPFDVEINVDELMKIWRIDKEY